MKDANNLESLYQQAVDAKARELLSYSPRNISSIPADEKFVLLIAGQEVAGEVWHCEFDDESHHVVFQLSRKSRTGIALYLSGVKLNAEGNISLMTFQEVSQYEL